MYDWIHIISNQWYITLSIHYITWIYCGPNKLSRKHITRSHVNLNKVITRGKISWMKRKRHRQYYQNLLISEYLSYIRQGTLAIYGTKISLTGLSIFQINISQISTIRKNMSLASQTKCDIIFSDPKSDHIFPHFFSVTYMAYILFVLIFGNDPLDSKRGRCWNQL